MVNGGDLVYAIPEQIADKIPFLMTLLKAVGIFVILYIIFSIINMAINWGKKRELKKINENLEEIKRLLRRSPPMPRGFKK